MDIVDVERCPTDVFTNVLRDLQGMPKMDTPADHEAFLAIMYGDEAEDLRIEQQREDLRKTRAQADKLAAEAAKARSEIGDRCVDR